MSQIGIEHDQHHAQDAGYQDPNATQWMDTSNTFNPSAHTSPVQEYTGFTFNPHPMEPMYTAPMPPPPRTTHQQLQPLIMPQWPSMLSSQASYMPPVFPTAPIPLAPAATPVSATATHSTQPVPPAPTHTGRTGSTPRKTLTDADRRRMCLYHEEHPTVKQTEIGAMFGVERSTVSKVLRQKEKYLYQDDGSRSPLRKSKGKFPDIERALSNWARNHQKQGLPLSDAMIREKARFFATTVGNSDSHLKANSSSWLEKFKHKNNLMGAGSKSRKNSLAEESDVGSNPPSNSATPSGISPTSPSVLASPSPVAMAATKSEGDVKTESPQDSYVDFNTGHRQPFHSQSNTSLSSVFTDAAASSTFSAGPTSPTSPFFTPDSGVAPAPFMPSQQARIPPGSSNFQRPRSQTFPMLGIDPYVSPPPSSEALTPKYMNTTAIESPLSDDVAPPMTGVDETMQPVTAANPSMQPPPLPASASGNVSASSTPAPAQMSMAPQSQLNVAQQAPSASQLAVSPLGITEGTVPPVGSPTQEDARRALEVVMNFFQHQPSGFVEPQEYMMIGKLMEKLKIKRNGELPGGMHWIPEQASARKIEGI